MINIYYDRAFIRIDDKYIPLVRYGNGEQYNRKSHRALRKNWVVLNTNKENQLLFTADEICDIAKNYELLSQRDGFCNKVPDQRFKKGQFEKWVLWGLYHAHTIEEYVRYDNVPYILDGEREYAVYSTESFLKIIKDLGSKQLTAKFADGCRFYRPPSPHKSNKKDLLKRDSYYVLYGKDKAGNSYYFVRLRRKCFEYTAHITDHVRPFRTEAEASKYIEKYHDKFGKVNFSPLEVRKGK